MTDWSRGGYRFQHDDIVQIIDQLDKADLRVLDVLTSAPRAARMPPHTLATSCGLTDSQYNEARARIHKAVKRFVNLRLGRLRPPGS